MPGISGISTTAGPDPATCTVFATPSTTAVRRAKSVIASSAVMRPAWTDRTARVIGQIARYTGNLAGVSDLRIGVLAYPGCFASEVFGVPDLLTMAAHVAGPDHAGYEVT